MSGIDENYLETILKSKGEDYFIASKRTDYASGGGFRRGDDEIWLISIPTSIHYDTNVRGLTIREVDKINATPIEGNIPLSVSYTPFQWGITIGSFYRAYPVKATREFIRKAWSLNSKDIWDYINLNKELTEPKALNKPLGGE
jgi:hypothetical protein